MKNKKAFTLIELMVVVLIVAVLTAVAFPHYRVSVEQSRALKAINIIHMLHAASNRAYIASETYSDNFTELDFEMSDDMTYSDQICLDEDFIYLLASGTDVGFVKRADEVTVPGSYETTDTIPNFMNSGVYAEPSYHYGFYKNFNDNTLRCFSTNTTGAKICSIMGCSDGVCD